MMQPRFILALLLACLLALTGACTSDHFTVEATINDMGNRNVRVVYVGDSGVTSQWTKAQADVVKVEGSAQSPTVLLLLNSQNRPLVRMVVKNGDHLKALADVKRNGKQTVTGNDVSEQWSDFINSNTLLYSATSRDRLDAAIEAYVAKHPDQMTSTVLLVYDHSNYGSATKLDGLLRSIDADCRPASLLQAISLLSSDNEVSRGHITPMLVVDDKGKVQTLNVTGRASLLYLWTGDEPQRRTQLNALQTLHKQWGDRLRVADIYLDTDSGRWSKSIPNDSVTWTRYRAAAGPAEQSLMQLHITQVPLLLVTDSLGAITYRGTDIAAATTAVTTLLK